MTDAIDCMMVQELKRKLIEDRMRPVTVEYIGFDGEPEELPQYPRCPYATHYEGHGCWAKFPGPGIPVVSCTHPDRNLSQGVLCVNQCQEGCPYEVRS